MESRLVYSVWDFELDVLGFRTMVAQLMMVNLRNKSYIIHIRGM